MLKKLALPRGWDRHVKSSVLQILSLAAREIAAELPLAVAQLGFLPTGGPTTRRWNGWSQES